MTPVIIQHRHERHAYRIGFGNTDLKMTTGMGGDKLCAFPGTGDLGTKLKTFPGPKDPSTGLV